VRKGRADESNPLPIMEQVRPLFMIEVNAG
jgi:hypothetical protein